VRFYLPLVRQIVATTLRRSPPNVTRGELMSAGMFGLFDALRKGGANRSEAFTAYARIRIRGAVVDELRASDPLTRSMRRRATEAEATGIGWRTTVVSIDATPETGVEDTRDDASPADQLDNKRRSAELAKAMSALPPRERLVVDRYYLQDVPLTLVARELNVTLGRASQLRASGILRLQSMLGAAPAPGELAAADPAA
jgi:RNA polymerase sigma factor for flagellar operon FliA